MKTKPPFRATNEKVNCTLPAVKPYNPVPVDAYCHGHALKNQLCPHASYCEPYLELIIRRMNEDNLLSIKILQKMGIEVEHLKRR